jgi:hypothetical protein
MTDRLSTLYQELLSGSYDCVDRIVLNAYFRMAHNPGGFRVWWRALTGSDETLENTYLMRMAASAGAFAAMPRHTAFRWSTVPQGSANTIWPKNIWAKQRSPKACF